MNTFKVLFLIVLVISIASASSKPKRGLNKEPVIFEVEVNARCDTYKTSALNSIQISRFTNPGCLPISTTDSTKDVNDRHSHIFCTNIGRGRSLFRFHEIFSVDEDETPVPGEIFIVSWLSSFPFIESTRKYNYLKRPSCNVKTDVCSSTEIVETCTSNPVVLNNGYVSTSDRVYFIPPGVTVGTCLLNSSCCPYISTSISGICGGKSGACANVTCDDNNNCTTDSCDPLTGQCVNTQIVCNDNNNCTTDSCNLSNGQCVFTQIVCNDNLNCTTDSCNPLNGQCVNTPITCNDNNSSTTDSCDPSNGQCVFTPIVCDDNDACTTDVMNPTCSHIPIVCDDFNACTSNSCNSTTGCVFTNINCNDNSACTTDSCNTTTGCVNTAIVCNDFNACTTDSCNSTTGCVFTNINCNDNNACTTDSCNTTTGCVNTAIVCNDNDPCTTDSCNSTTGQCVYTQLNCDDSNACTSDSCNSTGQCVHTAIVCNDGLNCTLNRCNTTTGCFYPPKPCSDNNACTYDSCDEPNGGNCVRTTFCDDGFACTDDTCNDPCIGLPTPCALDINNSQNATFKALYCVNTNNCVAPGICDKVVTGCCSNDPTCIRKRFEIIELENEIELKKE